jgi:DNA-binding CsgD family transcriptional regulator
MIDQQALTTAIDACYDAVVEPQNWQNALEQVALATNSRACSIHVRSAADARLRFPASPVYREFLTEFVADGWSKRDPRSRAWPLVEQGSRVCFCRDVVPEAERRTLPEYTYLYPKYDLPEWAGMGFSVSGDLWAMSLLRGKSQGTFDRENIQPLSTVLPHLPRFIKLSSHLAEKTQRASFELLEALSVSALQVNAHGKVIAINGPARALLGKDIDIAGGRLRIINDNGGANLKAAIDRAIKAHAASQFTALDPIVIARPDKRPLLVDIFPCVGSLHDVFGQSGAVVVLTDLADRRLATTARLSIVFGLTPMEARLATKLSMGLDIDMACAELRITKETARTHLKALFAKTQTRRQAELVLVLADTLRVNRR